jgi:mRNA interferase YafQ
VYNIEFSGQFKKDAKLCKKQNLDTSILDEALKILRAKGELPLKYKPHTLSGNYANRWECHIKGDWLLIWKQDFANKIIYLERTGTHSSLFKK